MGADDAKTRKNAALLIGDLHMSQLSDEVLKHTRLNRCAVVRAHIWRRCHRWTAKELLPQLMERAKELEHMTVTDENREAY